MADPIRLDIEGTQEVVGRRGDVVLVQTGVGLPLVFTAAGYQADLAHEFLFRDAVPESRVAGAEDGSQNAVAWRRVAPANSPLALPFAMRAGFFRQPYRF